jgi:hypothetical protein
MTASKYDVTLMYTSRAAATVKLSFGTYQAIRSGAAATITAQLPRQVRMALSNYRCTVGHCAYLVHDARLPIVCG